MTSEHALGPVPLPAVMIALQAVSQSLDVQD